MPNLGGAKYTLTVAGDKFKQGMTQAKGHAERTTKSIGASFGRAQAKIQATAGKVPVVGGALAGLATPAGLATAAIGLVVGGMAKMVSKTLDVGRRLGELREKLGVNAEAIQIYERAIEEGNGNTAAFEKTTLRLQKSIGDAANGNKMAAEQFDALGLSFEDLANKSPEEALKAVLGAANDTLGPTDRASVLAATLGRSYADLGGFATKGADDLQAMLDGVKETAVTMSGEGVTAVDEYDAANRDMRDSFGSIVTEVGMALIPTITKLFKVIKQAMPLIKTLIHLGLMPIKLAVEGVSFAVNIVSALLKGDFTGALKIARNYFISVATIILKTGAKIVGLFNKDLADSINGVVDDLNSLKTEAETKTEPALDNLGTAATTTATDFNTLTTAETATGRAAATLAIDLKAAGDKIVQDSADRTAKLIADYEAETDAIIARREAEEQDKIDRAAANKKFRDDELEADKTAWGITDVEYGLAQASLKTLSAEKYADLIEQAEAFGIDDLALLAAHNSNLAAAELAAANAANIAAKTQQDKVIANAEATAIGVNAALDKIESPKLIDIVANIRAGTSNIGGQHESGGTQTSTVTVNPDGTITYGESFGGDEGGPASSSSQPLYTDSAGNVFVDPGLLNPASDEAQKAFDDIQGAQYGAFVRGSRMGSLVRVGENFTDERITPAVHSSGGMGSGGRGGSSSGGRGGSSSGGRREYHVYLGEEKLTTLVLNAQNELEDTGRA